jgi:hypothetical protein
MMHINPGRILYLKTDRCRDNWVHFRNESFASDTRFPSTPRPTLRVLDFDQCSVSRFTVSKSLGHYLVLRSAILGLTLFPIGYLMYALTNGSESPERAGTPKL